MRSSGLQQVFPRVREGFAKHNAAQAMLADRSNIEEAYRSKVFHGTTGRIRTQETLKEQRLSARLEGGLWLFRKFSCFFPIGSRDKGQIAAFAYAVHLLSKLHATPLPCDDVILTKQRDLKN